MTGLAGKVALVTGASRGIGRAIAVRLAADGALVAVHYGSNEQAAKETVAAIEEAGGKAFTVAAELGVDGDVATLVARLTDGLTEHTGTARFDILVNNAATVSFSPLDALTEEEFDRIFAINAKAPLFLVKRALPLLRDGGRIINISTLATRTAPPAVGYVMSKGAVDVLSRTLAVELGGRGITVNAVAPGVVLTDVFASLRDNPDAQAAVASAAALGRLGRPDDIADAVGLLACVQARRITGQVNDVTGGLSLRPRTFG